MKRHDDSQRREELESLPVFAGAQEVKMILKEPHVRAA